MSTVIGINKGATMQPAFSNNPGRRSLEPAKTERYRYRGLVAKADK